MILTPYQQNDPLDQAVLTIDLTALIANYHWLDKQAGKAETGCVVKANAYGLGVGEIAEALLEAGCQTFFVAQAKEGKTLREVTKTATIYILNGLPIGSAAWFAKHALRPCLNAPAELAEWAAFCEAKKQAYPAALHIDTGFNRLGFSEAELAELAALAEIDSHFTPSLIMSHLACADMSDHPMNATQLARFQNALKHFPNSKACLANSAGILLGDAYHFDMVRAGIGLYGSMPYSDEKQGRQKQKAQQGQQEQKGQQEQQGQQARAQLQPVITLQAPILQIRTVKAGETVGYGASFTAEKNMRIAILAIGYSDGYMRQISETRPPFAQAAYNGTQLPIIGRISMDLLAVDISALPEAQAQRGTLLELIGAQIPLDETAQRAGTISYEILTRLGTRARRVYKS